MTAIAPSQKSRAAAGKTGLIMALIVIGQVMISLDFTVASVALPSIGRALAIGPSLVQWVLSGMSLAYGGFMIVGGRLSDLFGQRNCYLAGIALMTAGTLAASQVDSIGLLIPLRVLTGIGAAIALPATLSLIAVSFPSDQQRIKAIAITTMAQCLAAPIGTIAAGMLMNGMGWRGAFLLNVPFGLFALAAAPRGLPAHRRDPSAKRSIDMPGALLVTIGSGLLVWSLSGIAAQGFAAPSTVLWGFAGSLACIAAFVLWQRMVSEPLIPLAVLRSPNLPGGVVAAGVTAVGVAGMYALINISAQQALRLSPIQVGLMLIPYGAMSLVMSWIIPRISGRLVPIPRASILSGLLVLGGSNFIMALTPASNVTLLFFLTALLIAPVGLMLAMSVAIGEALSGVADAAQGIAAALIYTAQQIFLAIGISVMVSSVDTASGVGGQVPVSAFSISFLIGVGICVAGGIVSVLMLRARPVPILVAIDPSGTAG